MKKRVLTFLLLAFLTGCNNSSNSSVNEEYNSSIISENISSFSESQSEEKMILTNDELTVIFNNTLILKEVKIIYQNFSIASEEVFYVEDDLIYEKIENDHENYIYNDNKINYSIEKKYSETEYIKTEINEMINYDLSYFLADRYQFNIEKDLEETNCGYGYFDGRNGISFTNNDNIKMDIFINNELNILDGFLIRDENNNYIEEYVITLGKIDYKADLNIILEELKYEKCISTENCLGKYINGICNQCNSNQIPILINEYYQISNAGHLYWFADQVNNGETKINAELINDVVINDDLLSVNTKLEDDYILNEGELKTWLPIGRYNSPNTVEYQGIFNGNNYSISGIYIDDSSLQTAGFIGFAGKDSVIKNLTINDSYICAKKWVGGIAGYTSGLIDSCAFNESKIKSTYIYSNLAGIVGFLNSGNVNKCYTRLSNISGRDYVGGIVGSISRGSVNNCYNLSNVYCSEYGGGIVGELLGGKILNCYNAGPVNEYLETRNTIASIVGSISDDNEILNCYYLIDTSDVGHNDTLEKYQTTEVLLYDFIRGHITYLLQENQVEQIWGQNLPDKESVDVYPNFYGDKVYRHEIDGNIVYSNSEN